MRRFLKIETRESQFLLYIVYLCLILMGGLVVLEAFHVLVLRSWNAEVFSAIIGLLGALIGLIVGRRVE